MKSMDEALNFLHLLSDLRLRELDSAEILAAFDRFRARAGSDRFSYCPLYGAVHLALPRAGQAPALQQS